MVTSERKGEEINKENLKKFLRENTALKSNQIAVKQFSGGYSNLTYLLTVDGKDFVLRRPPLGANIKSAHDMQREFHVISMIKPFYDKIPEPIIYCDDSEVVGSPFYIMSKAEGEILRGSNYKEIAPSADTMRSLSKNTVAALADLHAIEIHDSGLINIGKPEGYTERQVTGWIGRYYKSQTDDLKPMDILGDWLKNNIPKTEKATLIHNDFKYDNLVLNPNDLTEIVTVLDWEMTTVGNPLMDLGTTLAYWSEHNDHDAFKSFNPSFLEGNLNREEVVKAYFEALGTESEEMLFYYIFGLYKVCVIAQQIYARFKKGFSKDARFGQLIYLIKVLSKMGVVALDKNRITNLSAI